ncbi:deaminase [bacterium]|nr:deaminase [bacterium]
MNNLKLKKAMILIFVTVLTGGSNSMVWGQNKDTKKVSYIDKYVPQNAREEADMMASRAGIACIYRDWQTNSDPSNGQFMRGYNIGSVMIDWNDTSIAYALNCVGCFNNGTQHGEVRVMQQYSFCTGNYYLENCTIYTNLEECAMCAGMMSLEKVPLTIYAQHDPCFGGALQRLLLNSKSLPGGYPPYPRVTKPVASKLDFYQAINNAYAQYCGSGDVCNCNIVAFLASSQAQMLYSNETNKFLAYTPIFAENQTLQEAFLLLYELIQPSNGSCDNVPLPIDPSCMPVYFMSKGSLTGKKIGNTYMVQRIKKNQ